MTQLTDTFGKLKKSLNVQSIREYLEIDNSNEVIESEINRLYKRAISNNLKSAKIIKESSIYQIYYSKLRGYSSKLGKPLSFRINKTPKNPQMLMKSTNQLNSFNLESIPTIEIQDYNQIFLEIREFLNTLKTKSIKWYNFFLVKIFSGLDYSDIVKLRMNDLKELNGFCIISILRNKTQCENFSILPEKATIELKNYLKTLNLNENSLLFPSNNRNESKSNVQMNPKSVNETIKRLIGKCFNSKKLRAITNQILNDFGKLSILEKDFYSKIWIGHKIQVHNVYTDKLRNPKYFLSEYLKHYHKFFNQLL